MKIVPCQISRGRLRSWYHLSLSSPNVSPEITSQRSNVRHPVSSYFDMIRFQKIRSELYFPHVA